MLMCIPLFFVISCSKMRILICVLFLYYLRMSSCAIFILYSGYIEIASWKVLFHIVARLFPEWVLMAASSSTLPSDCGEGNRKDKGTQQGINVYFSKNYIEENSPSRQDGVDLKTEESYRMSYSTFLRDMGIALRAPESVIATAIMFCHHFFLRQSHANNRWRTVAISCMFLASKVGEHARSLKDVILSSFDVTLAWHDATHPNKGSDEFRRIPREAIYEKNADLILVAERRVLKTLGYDLEVDLPYEILANAAKELNVDKTTLMAVAGKVVNRGLLATLWLQFKPNEVAISAIYLAGKRLKVELEIDGEKRWWEKFQVSLPQVEEFCDQFVKLCKRKEPSELRDSTSSDKKYDAPLIPPKNPEDEVANRIYDKEKAEGETLKGKNAMIEERMRAHVTSEKKTKSEDDSKDAS